MEAERLRAIAVMMVVLHHFSRMIPWSPLSRLGIGSIDLFFVLSGFLISKTLYAAFESAGVFSKESLKERVFQARYELTKFYIRRFFRIIPVGGFWLVVCVGISLWFNSSGAAGLSDNVGKHLFSIATLTFNYTMPSRSVFGSYWTLMIEEHFYILFPWFFLFLPTSVRRMKFLLPAILALIVYRTLSPGTLSTIFFHDIYRFDTFFVGSVVFHLWHHEKFFVKPIQWGWGLLISIFCVVAIWVVSFFMDPLRFERETITVSVLMSSVLVLLAAKNEGLVLEITGLKQFLEYIGKRSFSIYLIHEPLRVAFVEASFGYGLFGSPKAMGTYPMFWISYVSLLLILGEFSYRLLELPSMTLGRHFASKVQTLSFKKQKPCVE